MKNPFARLAASLAIIALTSAPPASALQVVNQLDGDVTLDWQVQTASLLPAIDVHVATSSSSGRLFTLNRAGTTYTLTACDGGSGAQLWSTSSFGGLADFAPELLAANSNGSSIFVVGTEGPRATIAKLDAASGAALWTTSIPAPLGFNASITAIDVSANGAQAAVVATGVALFNQAVYTVGINGTTGAVTWFNVLDDPAQFAEDARLVAIDPAGGRVYTASMAMDAGFTSRSLIRTFDLATGAPIWSELYPATGTAGSAPMALELDPSSGRLFVLVAGGAADELRAYASATGNNLWSAATLSKRTHIALQPGGAQIAVSGLGPAKPTVQAFDAAVGTAMWLGQINTSLAFDLVETIGLAYLPNGSRLVLGLDGNYQADATSPKKRFLAAALDATSGMQSWSVTELPTATTGGDVVGFALVDSAGGPRAVVSTKLILPHDADVRLVGLETGSGALSWEQTLSSSTTDAFDSFEDVALAPDGSRVYALGAEVAIGGAHEQLTVTASDPLSGIELWSTVVPDLAVSGAQLLVDPQGSTLFIGGGSLLFGAASLDASTGAILWIRTPFGPSVLNAFSRSIALAPDGSRLFTAGQILVDDPVTFATNTRAIVFALDPATGVELWVDTFGSDPKGDATGNDIAVSADSTRVYSTGYTELVGGGKDLFVRAFDTATGVAVWTTHFDLGSALGGASGSDYGTSLAVDAVNTRVFVSGTGAVAAPGSVLEPLSLALDATNGNVIWTSPATTAELTGLKAYSRAAELSPDGSQLFVVSFADQLPLATRTVHLRALSTSSGATTWQSSAAFPNDTQGTASDITVSPNGQRIFALLNLSEGPTPQTVVSNQRTFAYSAATGVELWNADRLGDTNSHSKGGGLAASDDYVVVAGTTDLAGNNDDGFLTRYSSKPLVSGPPELSLTAGGVVELELDATNSSAGNAYWILGSLAGTTPGLTVQGQLLPLNIDGYFTLMLTTPNSQVHAGSLGLLNASGRAAATFNYPPGITTSLAGLTLNHAFLTFDLLGTVTFTSNASAVDLVP